MSRPFKVIRLPVGLCQTTGPCVFVDAIIAIPERRRLAYNSPRRKQLVVFLVTTHFYQLR